MSSLGMLDSISHNHEKDDLIRFSSLSNPSNTALKSLLYARGMYDFAISHRFIGDGNQKRCYTDGITVWKTIEDTNRHSTSLFEDVAEIIWTDYIFNNQLKILGYDRGFLIATQPYVENVQIDDFQKSVESMMSSIGFRRTQRIEDKIYLEGDTIQNSVSHLDVWKRQDGFIVSDLKQKNATYLDSSRKDIFIYDCSVIRIGFREDGKIF